MTRFQTVSYRRFAEKTSGEPEPAQLEALIAKARGRARADGFEEGVAHAEALRDAAHEETLRGIADALNAVQAAREELRAEAAEATFAAIRDFVSAISPRLLAAGAAEAAAKALSSSVAGSPTPELTVRVAEDALARTRECFHAAGARCALKGDPTLPFGVARISGEGGFDEIDIRPAIDEALKALEKKAAPARGASSRAPGPKRSSSLFSEESNDG
ncbi:MAG: hypothetical protein AAFU55_01850 [Pseudomonadota bacterium]